jgi:putative phage-type endonuclease
MLYYGNIMENNMEQRSPEWFQARKGRITGSMCGAILGLAPYMTRDQALRTMVRSYHKAPSEFEGNIATEYGNTNEDGAIQQFEMERSLDVEAVGFYIYEDWAGASPDGLCSDGNGLEVKCPFGKRKDLEPVFKTAQEQPHYYAQMQWEMLCAGWTGMWFYQWSPHGSATEFVAKDQQWLDDNMPDLRQFYAFYLSELDNPEHIEPLRKEINTEEAKRLLDEYDQLGDAIANASERQKEVKDAIIKAAKGKDALMWGRKITKVQKQGSVSYAAVVKKHCKDVDLEPFRGKNSEYWKIT